MRVVVCPLRKPHLRQQFPRLLFQLGVHRLFVGAVVRALLCQQLPCQHHVLQGGVLREKVEVLAAQQGGLAGTGRADDGQRFTLLQGKGNIL